MNRSKDDTSPLETNLEKFIETMFEIEMLAFNPEAIAHSVFKRKIHNLVKGLINIDKRRAEVNNVYVPSDVIRFIDNDLSPEIYTGAMADAAIQVNMSMQEKMGRFQNLKLHLLMELKKAIPHVYDQYRARTTTQ
ncbi:mediator of RNA polymerase II transcription subunit 10-like [Scaptodrosophila lebanonensis]|uniref:Mediator of RNA polymerase II transcription subunit 10 n=1 Tax=Drosophila lebanonensis TaxID=7225 RepID=A0A6J2U2U6_DROLE|nr:mediator of RNA polymerase II transcription subunit 10-like [Scaptodrosophila lebanonensis]